MQFFTIFQLTLRTARKCGRLGAVVYETNQKYTYNFRGVRIPIFASFPIAIAMFLHVSSQEFE